MPERRAGKRSRRKAEQWKRHFERQRELHTQIKEAAGDILASQNFRGTKRYIQHGNMTVNAHCMDVAKYKVYIIDEVHMLTESAFNALLKTLEEPPKHIVFILATTEVHKLPATILSRCMRFDFHLINDNVLINHLKSIFAKEGVECDEDAYKLIAKAAQGSVRDMLSIADCLVAFCNKNITSQSVMKILGNTNHQTYLDICQGILNKDIGSCLNIVSSLEQQGKNMTVVAKDLTITFRNLLVAKTCQNPNEILGFTQDVLEKYVQVATPYAKEEFMKNMLIFSEIESEMKYALSPKTLIESAIVSSIMDIDIKKN